MASNVQQILKKSGLSPQSREYQYLNRLLTDLSQTRIGARLLASCPADVVVCSAQKAGIFLDSTTRAVYDDATKRIYLRFPTDKDSKTALVTAVALAHEMLHAVQSASGYSHPQVKDPQNLFALMKLEETETVLQDGVLAGQLKQLPRYQSVLLTDQMPAMIYQVCYRQAQSEHPDATEAEWERFARTQMAEAYLRCQNPSSLEGIKLTQSAINRWNVVYDEQAIRLMQSEHWEEPKSGFWGFLKKIAHWLNPFNWFTKDPDTQNAEQLAAGYAKNMNINTSPSALLRNARSAQLDTNQWRTSHRDQKGQEQASFDGKTGQGTYLRMGQPHTYTAEPVTKNSDGQISAAETSSPSKDAHSLPKRLKAGETGSHGSLTDVSKRSAQAVR